MSRWVEWDELLLLALLMVGVLWVCRACARCTTWYDGARWECGP